MISRSHLLVSELSQFPDISISSWLHCSLLAVTLQKNCFLWGKLYTIVEIKTAWTLKILRWPFLDIATCISIRMHILIFTDAHAFINIYQYLPNWRVFLNRKFSSLQKSFFKVIVLVFLEFTGFRKNRVIKTKAIKWPFIFFLFSSSFNILPMFKSTKIKYIEYN